MGLTLLFPSSKEQDWSRYHLYPVGLLPLPPKTAGAEASLEPLSPLQIHGAGEVTWFSIQPLAGKFYSLWNSYANRGIRVSLQPRQENARL